MHHRHHVNENPDSHYLTHPENRIFLPTIRTYPFGDIKRILSDTYRNSTRANYEAATCISPRLLAHTVDDVRVTILMPYTAIYAVASRKLPKLSAVVAEFVKNVYPISSTEFYDTLLTRLRNDTSAVIAWHGLAWGWRGVVVHAEGQAGETLDHVVYWTTASTGPGLERPLTSVVATFWIKGP